MRNIPTTTLALIIVCVGSFIGPLGMASVNIAIPALAAELQANAKMVSWLPTLFLLSNVALMLPFGKLADNYGRKRIYTYGLLLNALSTLMCAIGMSIEWLLFWRLIQGAASAMIFGTGVAILTSITPANKRGFALGITAACVYIGLTVAPAIGGWLTEYWGWRAVFIFPAPLLFALVALIKFGLKNEWKNDHKQKFDWFGSSLFALSATTLVIGCSLLPEWSGVVFLLLTAFGFSAFVFHQSRHSQPLIRVQMFKESRLFSMSLSTSLLMYASVYPLTFLLSLYLQYVKGFSPAQAGQIILVQAFAMAILAPFAGKLSDTFQHRILASLGCAVVALGYAFLTQINETSSAAFISGALILIGIGFGLFSTPNNNAIMGSVNSQELGVASASMNLARTIGNLIGMSLVNFLVHLYLGETKISGQQFPGLLTTVSISLHISFGCVVLACFLSALRGKKT